LVVVRAEVGVVAVVTLHAPDEALAPLRQRVEIVEPRHEAGHDRRVERPLHAADVDLREVNIAHRAITVHIASTQEATKTTKTRNTRKRLFVSRSHPDVPKDFFRVFRTFVSFVVVLSLCTPAQPVDAPRSGSGGADVEPQEAVEHGELAAVD